MVLTLALAVRSLGLHRKRYSGYLTRSMRHFIWVPHSGSTVHSLKLCVAFRTRSVIKTWRPACTANKNKVCWAARCENAPPASIFATTVQYMYWHGESLLSGQAHKGERAVGWWITLIFVLTSRWRWDENSALISDVTTFAAIHGSINKVRRTGSGL